MVQPATLPARIRRNSQYNRFEKWFNPQRSTEARQLMRKYNRFEKWFNPQPEKRD